MKPETRTKTPAKAPSACSHLTFTFTFTTRNTHLLCQNINLRQRPSAHIPPSRLQPGPRPDAEATGRRRSGARTPTGPPPTNTRPAQPRGAAARLLQAPGGRTEVCGRLECPAPAGGSPRPAVEPLWERLGGGSGSSILTGETASDVTAAVRSQGERSGIDGDGPDSPGGCPRQPPTTPGKKNTHN